MRVFPAVLMLISAGALALGVEQTRLARALEPGSHGVPWLLTAIGSVFLAVGALLAWAAPKLIAPAPRRDRH